MEADVLELPICGNSKIKTYGFIVITIKTTWAMAMLTGLPPKLYTTQSSTLTETQYAMLD